MSKPSAMMIAIIVLLNLYQLYSANAAITSFRQSHHYPQKNVTYNNYAMKEGNLVYAVCDDNKNDKSVEKTCTIVQHQFPYDKVARSCNVTLKVKYPENVNLTDKISVHAFGQENAILFWGEVGSRATFNLMAIQLSSCKTRMLELDDPQDSIYTSQIYTHKILTYDNDFDIFVDSTKLPSGWLRNQTGWRVSFDREPQPIFNVIEKKVGDVVMFMSPIATRSPNKGYVYSGMEETGNTIVLVKPDGTRKLLESHTTYNPMTSANYDYITTCIGSENESQTICTQYNANGEIKFKVNIDQDKKTFVMTVHSTPHGGFLLVKSGKFLEQENHITVPSYDVIRVDAEGRQVGSIRLIGLAEKFYNMGIFNVWEHGDEFCITFASQANFRADNVQIDVNCFSENDFSM